MDKIAKKMTDNALSIVQGFIDDHLEDKDKAHISTYIRKDELGAIIFLVNTLRSSIG